MLAVSGAHEVPIKRPASDTSISAQGCTHSHGSPGRDWYPLFEKSNARLFGPRPTPQWLWSNEPMLKRKRKVIEPGDKVSFKRATFYKTSFIDGNGRSVSFDTIQFKPTDTLTVVDVAVRGSVTLLTCKVPFNHGMYVLSGVFGHAVKKGLTYPPSER